MKINLKFNRQRIDELFIIGVILMYIPILPIDVETQPLLCLLAVTIGTYYVHLNKYVVKPSSIIALLLVFIILGGLVHSIGISSFAIVESAKYLVGPIIYILMRDNLKYYQLATLKNTTIVLLIIAILTAFNFGPISKLLANAISHIIERSTIGGIDGMRGISLISNEPSYAAGQLIFLLLITDFFRINNDLNNSSIKTIKYIKFAIIIMIVLTKSALGILFLAAYTLPLAMTKFNARHALLIIASSVVLTIAENLKPSRISQVFTALSEVDLNNLLLSLSILEPSGTTRIFLNISAFSALIFNPIGFGIGSFQNNWYNLLDKLGMYFLANHEVLGNAYTNQLGTNASTYLANITHDLGVVPFILIISLLIHPLFRPTAHRTLRWQIVLSILIMFFFQSQITNPVPWALLVILHHLTEGTIENSPS